MAKIKVLKDHELIGGEDNTSVYPITSTKAVYSELNERLDVTLDRLEHAELTNSRIANDTIEIEKLSPALREIIRAATGVPEDLTSTLTKTMRTVYPLEANITINPIDLQEKGTSTEVTITWNATIEGETITPERVFINEIDVTYIPSYVETISDTKDFYIQITAQGRTKTENKSVVYVYPIFTGFSADTEFTENLIESLTKLELRSSLGTITDTKTNTSMSNYYWIVSPYKITNVVNNGINLMSNFIYTIVEYKGATYNCYRLDTPSSTDTFTFIIS